MTGLAGWYRESTFLDFMIFLKDPRVDDMANFLAVAIAVFLDRLFGELPIYHPLKGFTRVAHYLEDQWHLHSDLGKHVPAVKKTDDDDLTQPPEKSETASKALAQTEKIKGALATGFLVLPFVSICAIISQSLPVPLNFVFNAFLLYLALGAHNLKEHAFAVQNALVNENLESARTNLAAIVNRDTKQMDRQDLISTCIESILENGCEMILAPIFWYLVGNSPLTVMYILVHTLNNMWGYQSAHYKNFGWAVITTNNIMNWIPSRIAAFSYMLLGDMKNSWSCFNAQAKNWNSANTVVVVATGAGALHLEVGGDLYYQGQLKPRATLGQGKLADLSDIARAIDLIDRSLILWLVLTLMVGLGH